MPFSTAWTWQVGRVLSPMSERNVVFTTLHAEQPWSMETYESIDGYKAWRKVIEEKNTTGKDY